MLDRSDGESLRSAFLQRAQERPAAPALAVRGKTISYERLEASARRWAGALLGICASGRAERVGIFAYRSEVSYGAALAALFSGAAFVPLNPSFPADRTAAMVEQAGVDAIIADASSAPRLTGNATGATAPPLLIPDLPGSKLPGYSGQVVGGDRLGGFTPLQPLPPLVDEDVAYLLFTSGSTGAPKGVPVTHGNAMHFIQVMTRRYSPGPEDRFSQTFDQTFDLSIFDLFMAWSCGACVCSLSPVELLNPVGFVNRNKITVWFSVPSVAVHMVRRGSLLPGSMPSLRLSLFCGEPLPRGAAEAWQAAAANSIVENLYGPTELTIACFVHRWDARGSGELCRNGLVPIGRPLPGLGATVVGGALAPLGDGEVGELCVSGPQTTPGYWQDPAKTAEKYVHLGISPGQSRRFYCTGDLVARLPGGEYIFCGRADDQIKVLGHRVELGEVEAALRSQPGVEHAVAFGWPVVAGSAQAVVAFVSGEALDAASLIEGVKLKLPGYAVPREIFAIKEMPLNSNGKLDRRALRERLPSSAGGPDPVGATP